FVAEEVRELMARLGVRTMDEMIGRTDLLRSLPATDNPKATTLDLSAMLHLAMPVARVTHVVRHHVKSKAHHSDGDATLNGILMELARPALENRERVKGTLSITNADRAVGATISGEIARRYGSVGLP